MKADFSKCSNARVIVIGDLMLDRYIYGVVERMCPESSTSPILDYRHEKTSPGGCGMVASNIRNLEAHPVPVCVVGDDAEGRLLIGKFKDMGIETGGIFMDKGRPTTTKTRLVSEQPDKKIIVRLDRESRNPVAEEIENSAIEFLEENIPECGCVIISDYCKGLVTDKIARSAVENAEKFKKPIIVDTKGSLLKYSGASLFTPNEKEALKFAKELSVDEKDIFEIGKALSRKAGSSVLVKMGEKGVALFEKDDIVKMAPTAKKVVNVSGAGDILVSTAGVMLACGFSIKDAVETGNKAAGIAIGKEIPKITLEELDEK
jgi:D-beta-D-heptose 7-phosphate kinase/D-beta-D-heptose 1-phosphate adenosyltransferase